jgi:endonuclease/exonuclease/phosphatase family metal-dependent hydrolase
MNIVRSITNGSDLTRGMRRFLLVSVWVFAVVWHAGCELVLPDDDRVTLLSWNIENLFDAVDQGTEYHEFTADGGWTERDYRQRKQRIAEAVHALRPRPDILIFIEIENEQVLDALVDRYIVDIETPYRTFTSGPGAAIGIGVASRYPITKVRNHLARSGEFPPLRPVLEVHFDIAGEPLVVFANHWKSKRGGAPATEPLRRASAHLLSTRIEQLRKTDPDLPVIVTGDFNERPQEFILTGRSYPCALMPADEVARLLGMDGGTAGSVGAHSSDLTRGSVGAHSSGLTRGSVGAHSIAGTEAAEPPSWATPQWFEHGDFLLIAPDAEEARTLTGELDRTVLVDLWATSDASGSFYFINRWERIDSMLLSTGLFNGEGLRHEEFVVSCPVDGCDSQGRPLSWEDHPRGVSDHLPLMVTFTRPGD